MYLYVILYIELKHGEVHVSSSVYKTLALAKKRAAKLEALLGYDLYKDSVFIEKRRLVCK